LARPRYSAFRVQLVQALSVPESFPITLSLCNVPSLATSVINDFRAITFKTVS